MDSSKMRLGLAPGAALAWYNSVRDRHVSVRDFAVGSGKSDPLFVANSAAFLRSPSVFWNETWELRT
jgi:hypothetical protein